MGGFRTDLPHDPGDAAVVDERAVEEVAFELGGRDLEAFDFDEFLGTRDVSALGSVVF